MSTPNRWAVRDAAEVSFFNLETGDAIVTLKTLKMTEVQTTGETVYARGGRGNAKLVGFSSDREATVTLQDAIFDNYALAMLTGNDLVEGVKEISLIYESTVGTGLEVDLPYLPTDITSVYVLDADGLTNKTLVSETEGTPEADEYSIADETLTFHADLEDSLVRIYYKANTDSDAKTVRVTTDSFGGTFKAVADVLVRDELTKRDFFGQVIIHNAKIEDDFSFDFSPDGDPSVMDMTLEILKNPHDTNMWELVIYDGVTEPAE